jgi:hypothetical protein
MGNDVAVMVVVYFDGVKEMEGEPKEVLRYLSEKEVDGYNLNKFECFEFDEDARSYNDYVDFGADLTKSDLEEMV